MKARGLKRKRVRGRRFDPSDLRRLVRDQRLWCALGVVVAPDDGGLHFDLDGEDLLVEVEIQPSQLDLTCRLGSPFGGPNLGLWQVPPVGAEVVVLLPEGEIEFQPTIVAVLSSGALPADVAENTVVIAEAQVLIHDGMGGAEPLITKSQFDQHKHGTGVGPSTVPDNIATSGTVVLKAK